jgi:DNA-binding response OmpR family regulator
MKAGKTAAQFRGGHMSGSVLLIEDEPHIIEAITFILERDGWTVTSHSDGASAVERVADVNPNVIILDAMLPGRTGFEILRDLRARDGMAELPVLMLTAKGQAKDREAAEAAGASRFMTKPFSNREVLDAVRALAG